MYVLPGRPAPEMAVVDELSPTPGPLASLPSFASLFVPVDFKSSLEEAFWLREESATPDGKKVVDVAGCCCSGCY